jgi:hypothetical protein
MAFQWPRPIVGLEDNDSDYIAWQEGYFRSITSLLHLQWANGGLQSGGAMKERHRMSVKLCRTRALRGSSPERYRGSCRVSPAFQAVFGTAFGHARESLRCRIASVKAISGGAGEAQLISAAVLPRQASGPGCRVRLRSRTTVERLFWIRHPSPKADLGLGNPSKGTVAGDLKRRLGRL